MLHTLLWNGCVSPACVVNTVPSPCRDWEGVQGVLDTMKSVQMTLSAVTYGALTSALAMLGQMVKLRQVS